MIKEGYKVATDTKGRGAGGGERGRGGEREGRERGGRGEGEGRERGGRGEGEGRERGGRGEGEGRERGGRGGHITVDTCNSCDNLISLHPLFVYYADKRLEWKEGILRRGCGYRPCRACIEFVEQFQSYKVLTIMVILL